MSESRTNINIYDNKNYYKLYSLFEFINTEHITLSTLKTPAYSKLYSELLAAADAYISRYVMLSAANRNKVGYLLSGGCQLKDIQADMLSHFFFKLENVLSQYPASRQMNYIYKMINNKLSDYCNEASARYTSLEQQVYSGNDSSSKTYEDCYQDNRYNPEAVLIERETVAELTEKYRKLKEMRYIQNRNRLIATVDALKNKRAELLCLLVVDELKKKPAAFTEILISGKLSPELIERRVLKHICKTYGITDEVTEILATSTKPLQTSSFKLDCSPDAVSAQISRLKGRGKDVLRLVK